MEMKLPRRDTKMGIEARIDRNEALINTKWILAMANSLFSVKIDRSYYYHTDVQLGTLLTPQ